MLAFLKQWELYCFAISLALMSGIWWRDHRAQFDKGYQAAVAAQQQAIVAYQKLVVEQVQEKAKALAELTTQHQKQIDEIEAAKPKEVEKTSVIVQQIPRPDNCNLQPVELQDFNQAINSANGDSGG